jgi:hypothetical protein
MPLKKSIDWLRLSPGVALGAEAVAALDSFMAKH